MASTSPEIIETFMWRLNCPAICVLMTRKSRFATSKASVLTLRESPDQELIHAHRSASACPAASSRRLVGKSALLGPNNTVSIRKCFERKATTATTTTATALRTRWGRSAARWSQKLISTSEDSIRLSAISHAFRSVRTAGRTPREAYSRAEGVSLSDFCAESFFRSSAE
jgi:hypothetical protein